MQTVDIGKKITTLAKEGDARFLEIGKLLRDFYDSLTDEDGSKGEALRDLLKGTKISRRRALYWIEIDRVYSELQVPPQRLAGIGWTKLSLIAKHVDDEDVEALLSLAEKSTADVLRAVLNGQGTPVHTLAFKLTQEQYALVTGTLLANGAYLTGGVGLANKEIALMKVCRTVHKAWKAGIF